MLYAGDGGHRGLKFQGMVGRTYSHLLADCRILPVWQNCKYNNCHPKPLSPDHSEGALLRAISGFGGLFAFSILLAYAVVSFMDRMYRLDSCESLQTKDRSGVALWVAVEELHKGPKFVENISTMVAYFRSWQVGSSATSSE